MVRPYCDVTSHTKSPAHTSSPNLGIRITPTVERKRSRWLSFVLVPRAYHGEALSPHIGSSVSGSITRENSLLLKGEVSIAGTLESRVHNMFLFVGMGRNPGDRLLRHWNKKQLTYGRSNYGIDKINNFTDQNQKVCTKEFTKYCGMNGERYHNAWARKTYSGRMLLVTLGLGELLWSEEQAMSVSGHRSAEQMRRDYDYNDRDNSRTSSGRKTLREQELSARETWRSIPRIVRLLR